MDNTAPYPGVAELLDALTQKRIPMTILSNKPDDFTKEMVAKLLPDWRFDIVQGALDDIPIKPDPAAALDILSRLNVKPSECLYLGDTNTDMKTAVNAGLYPIGALWGFRTKKELLENGAETLAKHPTDIIRILDAS